MDTDDMIPLTTYSACVYLCLCMSSLTLIASIMALYILISLTKPNKDNGGNNVEENVRQEGRQRVEPARPLCLATQLQLVE